MTHLSRIIAGACAASLLVAGAAVAAPASPLAPALAGPNAAVTQVAIVMKGTRAGDMKQRRRTRTTYCRNTPSRC